MPQNNKCYYSRIGKWQERHEKAIFIFVVIGLLCVVLQPKQAHAASPSVVQTCASEHYNTNPTVSCTLSSSTTAGNTLVAFASSPNLLTLATTTGCGVTWVLQGSASSTGFTGNVYTGSIASGGSCTVSETATGGSAGIANVQLWEMSGTNGLDGSPVFNYNATYCTTSCTGESITTTRNGDLVLYGFNVAVSTTISNFTPFSIDLNTFVDITTFLLSHLVQTTAGSTNATFSINNTAAFPEMIMAFNSANDDLTPPSVTLVSPSSGSVVSSTITLSASSTDNVAVSGVQFQIDGVNLGSEVTATSGPTLYSKNWNTASSTDGTHIISAISYDTSNNSSTATSSVIVHNASLSVTTSTSLSFSCVHGSTATSSQSVTITNVGTPSSTLSWSATSTQSWLTFSANSGSLAGSASTSLLLIANPSGLSIGTYTATATVSDVNSTSSAKALGVSFTISSTNASTSITTPPNGATVSSTIAVTASATSSVGVTSVQFYLDGIALDSAVTSSPYTVSWNTASSSNGSHALYSFMTDADANTATSSNVTVTVSNASRSSPPPSTPALSVGVPASYGMPDYIPANPSSSNDTASQSPPSTLSSLESIIVSLQAQLQSLSQKSP